MNELIYKLEELTELSRDAIRNELSRRLNVPVSQILTDSRLETELNRWVMELWSMERNECDAKNLWQVDQKYSKILAKMTVEECLEIMGESTLSSSQ